MGKLAIIVTFLLVLAGNSSAEVFHVTPNPTMDQVLASPSLYGSPALGSYQWLATKFTVANAYTVDRVEGWMLEGQSYASANNAPVVVSIYSDGGQVPGTRMFAASFTPSDTLGWYGAGGLAWRLEPGTYWVAFEVDRSLPSSYAYEYTMPLKRDDTLDGAGWNKGHATLDYSANDLLRLGVRLSGTLVSAGGTGGTTQVSSTRVPVMNGWWLIPSCLMGIWLMRRRV